MIERYVITAQRVRQELADLERVIARAESALAAAQEHSEERGFYLDPCGKFDYTQGKPERRLLRGQRGEVPVNGRGAVDRRAVELKTG